MFERVAIVGAGVAGLAATWAAAQRGAQIRLFDGGVGASCLMPGAVDDRPWDEVARSTEVLQMSAVAASLPTSVRVFSDDLLLWRLPRAGDPLARLATTAGRVRLARGHDAALLDLARVDDGSRILLPRVPRAEWDADSLAHALNADDYAQSRRLRFEAADAKVLKHVGEDRIAAADLASRHDDDERRAWLAERLREMIGRAGSADAVMVGPWLGAMAPRAADISQSLRIPAGEVLGDVGGAPGLRFEAARASLLDTVGVAVEPYRVDRIEPGDEIKLLLENGDVVISDSVVLALGGVAAGGVIYEAPEQSAGVDMPERGGAPWRLSLDIGTRANGQIGPHQMQAHGRVLDVVGSIHGPPLDEVAWPVDADPGFLEAVGVRCDGLRISSGLLAAGDVIADKPRTVLQAAYSGIRAGAVAAGEPGSIH